MVGARSLSGYPADAGLWVGDDAEPRILWLQVSSEDRHDPLSDVADRTPYRIGPEVPEVDGLPGHLGHDAIPFPERVTFDEGRTHALVIDTFVPERLRQAVHDVLEHEADARNDMRPHENRRPQLGQASVPRSPAAASGGGRISPQLGHSRDPRTR